MRRLRREGVVGRSRVGRNPVLQWERVVGREAVRLWSDRRQWLHGAEVVGRHGVRGWRRVMVDGTGRFADWRNRVERGRPVACPELERLGWDLDVPERVELGERLAVVLLPLSVVRLQRLYLGREALLLGEQFRVV